MDDDVVEVHLALPWRPAIEVEYLIRGQWPITQGTVRCAISVQGPYDFLHDVTCRKIQSLCSRYRQVGFTFFTDVYCVLTLNYFFVVGCAILLGIGQKSVGDGSTSCSPALVFIKSSFLHGSRSRQKRSASILFASE